MKIWARRIGFFLALGFLVLTFVNASWLAPSPRGPAKLVAHRGVYQWYDNTGLGRDTCTANRIEQPIHTYLENTLQGLDAAKRLGAQMVELDIAPTKDGRIAVFHDWTVDCRTNGKGETRDHTLAELQALDAGYGYTADGGRTFPFRGLGTGLIPSLEDFVAQAAEKPLAYNFKSRNPAEADMLAAALKAMGRDVEGMGDSFYGHPRVVARMKTHFPKAWGWSKEAAKACTIAYLWQGWLGLTPDACRDGTLIVPINRQWAFAGWPNRTIARMEEVGARIIMVGAHGEESAPMGLDLPEQLGDVPRSFNGWVWVDDMWAIGPALRPAYNKRRPPEDEALERALEARRKLRD